MLESGNKYLSGRNQHQFTGEFNDYIPCRRVQLGSKSLCTKWVIHIGSKWGMNYNLDGRTDGGRKNYVCTPLNDIARKSLETVFVLYFFINASHIFCWCNGGENFIGYQPFKTIENCMFGKTSPAYKFSI